MFLNEIMLKRKFFIIFIIFILGYFYFKKNFYSKKKNIVIGMMSGWPPFMTINSKGNMEGFDIDLVRELEKEIGTSIEIQDCGSVSSLFTALEKGAVDVIMSGFDITQQRKKKYNIILYSDLYRVNEAWCITKEETLERVKNNLMLNRPLKIGLEGGSSMEPALNLYPFVEKIYFSAYSDMIFQVSENYIDAFIIDKTHADSIVKEKKSLDVFPLALPADSLIDGIGLILSKKNLILYETISHGIKQLKEKGIISKLEEKWNIGIH